MRHQTAKRARIAKSLDKRVAAPAGRRRRADRAGATGATQVRFPIPPHTGRLVLEADGLAKAYGGPPVFEDVTFAVERGERLLDHGTQRRRQDQPAAHPGRLVGADRGDVAHRGRRVRWLLRPGARRHPRRASASSTTSGTRSIASERDRRALLGMFGLVGDIAFQDAGTLSGGEKTKLALAQLVAGQHNLLLLDEPTNNLDPPSRDAIGTALADWPGTMILVSHDVGFVTELAPDRVLLMPDGTEDHWSDDLLDLVALA